MQTERTTQNSFYKHANSTKKTEEQPIISTQRTSKEESGTLLLKRKGRY